MIHGDNIISSGVPSGVSIYDGAWDDMRTALSSARRRGSSDPVWTKLADNGAGSVGVYAHAFSASAEQELFFEIQMSHQWDEGTAVKPHIHWCPIDATAGDVVWGLEYTVTHPVGGVYSSTTILSVTDASEGVANGTQIAPWGEIDMTGQRDSCVFVCRVFRDATNVADTYAGVAFGLSVDFHYRKNSNGSLLEYPGAPA